MGYYRTMKAPVMERLFYDFKGRPIDAYEFESLIRRRRRNLHVADTFIKKPGRTIRVSTVLLGTNYAFMNESPRPLIFETMIFEREGGIFDGIQYRYATVKQARIGHHYIVKMVNEVLRRRRPLINKGGKP